MRTVVIAAWPDDVDRHPMPERTDGHFVHGDLTDVAVLRRTSPEHARAVLVTPATTEGPGTCSTTGA